LFEALDFFEDFAETFSVPLEVAAAGRVANDGMRSRRAAARSGKA
jgi:hypothetical protein